jgi:dolichyl-diphosphooligosaccharide--protein glycosyltransferase
MSNRRGESEDPESEAVVSSLARYYHYPVLFLLVVFTFWNRIRNFGSYIIDGKVYLSGNDPYYHLRSTTYVVRNFPETMPFDPFTYFPFGTSSSQFGTLFDQLIALLALLVGLGDPSDETIREVFLVAPSLFAVAACIPAYVIGRRLGGRMGGLITVSFVAFASDRFLLWSVAGRVDHHSAELLFMSLAVLGVMVALRVAEQEKPVYELIVARDVGALRGTVGWSMLAGVALAAYIWVWPPGVFLYGILGLFFIIHMSVEHVRGRSPEHAAFVGVISLATAGILQLGTVQSLEVSATARSLLQPGLALAVAVGVVFLAWLSRVVERTDLSRVAYPGAVAGSITVSAALMALLLPDLFSYFLDQLDRVFGIFGGPGGSAVTVGEITPMEFSELVDSYKLGIFTAFAGGLVLLVKQLIDREPRGEHLLVVVWFLAVLAMAFTQVRFAYYLTIPIGALNAALVGVIVSLIKPSEQEFSIESYQILTIAVIVLVIIVPMLVISPTPIERSDDLSQPGNAAIWDDSLQWMEENTPAPGQYANPGGEAMDPYGAYTNTDDFEYSEGAYGVLSWWDYGHWITVEGTRIPNANPFQQGAGDAASFLLSQDKAEAMSVLSDIDESENARTQYVMIDWLMVEAESGIGGKFFAPPAFVDEVDRSDFYSRIVDTDLSQQIGLVSATATMRHKQAYYDSMAVRLYHYHGSAKDPEPIVLNWQGGEQELTNGETFTAAPAQGPVIETFENMTAAREAANQSGTAQVGGIGTNPAEPVEALEQFRLVQTNEIPATAGNLRTIAQRTLQNTDLRQLLEESDRYQDVFNFLYDNTPSWTKTFERVSGGTITGTGPSNTTLRVQTELEPENGAPFSYFQRVETDENGQFEATVPYSTTGYEQWGVDEGYTNVSVRATGPYTVVSENTFVSDDGDLVRYSDQVNVTEGQVIGENETASTVELEQEVVLEDGENGDDGDGGETNETGAEATSGGDNESGQTEAIEPAVVESSAPLVTDRSRELTP